MGIFSYGSCSLDVVSCDHADCDSCFFAVEYCIWNSFLERIFDTCNSQNNQILFQFLKLDWIFDLRLFFGDFFITK